MTPKDRRLERSIQIASLEAYASQSPEERRTAWERLKRLIAQRSPERVREMEIEKGLRPRAEVTESKRGLR